MARTPQVDPYSATLTPYGSVDPQRATAADFGGDGGFGRLGEGIENLGTNIDAVQQDQARIWASTAIAQAEVQTRQKWQQHVNSLDPTAADYPDQIAKLSSDADETWTQATADLQSKAPTQLAGRMVAAQMGRGRVGFTASAMDQQSQLNGAYTVNLVTQGAKAKSDLLAASPDNDTYTRLVQQEHDSISGLNTVDPNVKLKLIENTEHQFAVVQAESFASKNPQQFLSLVGAQGGIQTKGGGHKGAVPTLPGSGTSVPNPGTTPAAPAAAPTSFLTHLPSETQGYVPSVLKRLGSAAPKNADGTASQALVQAVIGQESGGNADAKSGKGASGLMQLMPATAASMGAPPSALTDPIQNVAFGTEYLNKMLKRYHGDVSQALAAYNAGPGNVDGALTAAAKQAAAASLPQVQPLSDQDIAKAEVPLAGWNKLTWGEKVQTVRQAEGLLGKQLSDDRGATTSALQDYAAAVKNGVTPAVAANDPKFSLSHLTALYGPDEGPRKYQEVQGLQTYRQAFDGLATMPSAQAEATIQNYAAGAGGAGAAVTAPLATDLRNAYVQVVKQRNHAPMDFAEGHGLGGYQELDWTSPQKLQQGLPARVATARTLMNEYGTPPQVFTAKDVAQAQVALGKLSPQDRVNYAASIARGINDPRLQNVALRQIMPKGSASLMFATNLALTPGGVALPDGSRTSNVETSYMISEGDAILHPKAFSDGSTKNADNPAQSDVPVGRGVLTIKDADFRKAVDTAVGGPGAFAGPNAEYAARMESETLDAVKAYYVAEAKHDLKDVSDVQGNANLIQNAVWAVTGGVWKKGNGQALFAPQGMPMAQFQDQFGPRAAQALQAAGYDSKQSAQIYDKAQAVNWGNGKYLLMNGGRPQVSPTTGKPIVIDYSQPYAPDSMAGLDPNARAPAIPVDANAAAALEGLGR